ncbi:Protein SCO1-like protein, mitochondrial-like [Oopsacas minuta]|uniref:Protein SCO1-like protein, mitochondrial-like n=1 Tax=Oopsacas minuta TaxID=111878 RepID=A0AAV7JUW5_9METZ|nr:Protein SCO1-like protein, mitochondrial-like [Oopsacas minuta]
MLKNHLKNVSNLLNRLTSVRTKYSPVTIGITCRNVKRTISGETKQASKFKGPVSWTSLALIVIAGGIIVYTSKKMQDEKRLKKAERASQAVGKAAIGGPFSLVDHDGNPKTDKDYLGKWILIYFGFTFCPDICPEELEKIGDIIDNLDKIELLPKLNPLLISVDPIRDTPEKIKIYLNDFHPKIVGLTGTPEQIDEVAKNYRVYYSQSKPDSDNDYLVDHTIITYLVNPNGEFVDYYGKNKTVAQVTAGITNHMLAFKHSN